MNIEEFSIDNLPPLFDQRVLAQVLVKSKAWCERSRWDNSGPPFYKVGAQVRYKREDVLDWLNSRKKNVMDKESK